MVQKLHKIAAFAATGLIGSFLIATVAVELFGSYEAVAVVKRSIWYGIFLLIPLMAATGMTGAYLGRGGEAEGVIRKKRRMPLIALNGVIVLIPAAYWLDTFASQGLFDTLFYSVQGVELLFGCLNLVLMIKNIRDGRKLVKRSQ